MGKVDIVKNYIEITQRNLDTLKKVRQTLYGLFPLTNYENISFDDKIKIDAFVHRVSKLQDSLGRLIRFYLEFEGIDTSSLTPRDIYNIAQKYHLIMSVEEWFMIRDLRNNIAHDYCLFVNELTAILNRIYDLSIKLINTAENVIFMIKNKLGEADG